MSSEQVVPVVLQADTNDIHVLAMSLSLFDALIHGKVTLAFHDIMIQEQVTNALKNIDSILIQSEQDTGKRCTIVHLLELKLMTTLSLLKTPQDRGNIS